MEYSYSDASLQNASSLTTWQFGGLGESGNVTICIMNGSPYGFHILLYIIFHCTLEPK